MRGRFAPKSPTAAAQLAVSGPSCCRADNRTTVGASGLTPEPPIYTPFWVTSTRIAETAIGREKGGLAPLYPTFCRAGPPGYKLIVAIETGTNGLKLRLPGLLFSRGTGT